MSSDKKFTEMQEIYNLDLRSHCIFCLKRYSQDEVNCFEGKYILPFVVLRSCVINDGEGLLDEAKNNVFNQEKNFPPICGSCFGNFEEVQKLQEEVIKLKEQLRKKVQGIKDVVSGASPGGTDSAWNQFVEIVKSSGVPLEQVKLTCRLVRNLQQLINTEETVTELACEASSLQVKTDGLDDSCFEEGAVDNIKLELEDCSFDDDDDYNGHPESPIIVPEPSGTLHNNQKRKRKRKSKLLIRKKVRTAKVRKYETVNSALKKQECDLCGLEVPIEGILSHVQEHVKDYATKCANPWCPYVFSCQMKMVRHLQGSRRCRRIAPAILAREAAGVNGKCEICHFKSKSVWHIRDHLRMHESEMKTANEVSAPSVVQTCPLPGCSESFYLNQSMEHHIFHHNLRTRTQQKCPLCNETFELSNMEAHFKDFHQVTEIFKCGHCSFLFDNADDKIKHVYEHRDMKGAPCDICDDASLKIRPLITLRNHYFNVHKLGTSPAVVCQYCGKEYSSSSGLKSHERLIHSDITGHASGVHAPSRRHKCDLCPQEFSSPQALKNHKIKIHGSSHIPCKLCSETFQSTFLLKRHLKIHNGAPLLHMCKIEGCNRGFKCRSRLSNHYETCHWEGKEKPYKCDTCGKGFGLKRSLQRHNEAIHLKTRVRVVCDECGESFAKPECLKSHKLIHTGEKPHVCNICGQAFRHPSTLWHHTKSHEKKGDSFRGRGPFKNSRKRIERDQ